MPAKENFDVFGLDFSYSMVKEAERRGIEIILGNAYHLPIKEKTFGVVMFFTTLEFLNEKQALDEGRRILKIMVG